MAARHRVLAALLCALPAVSCGSPNPAGPTATAPIEGTPSVEVRRFIGRSNETFDDTPGERIELTIEGATLRFDVSCNETRIDYELIEGVLRLDHSRWTTTAVACFAEDDAAAPRLFELLDSSPTFTIVDDLLTIRSSTGDVELLDATAPHPDDLPLAGTDWGVRFVVDETKGRFMSLTEPLPVVRVGPSDITVVFGCRTAQLPAIIDLDTRTITMAAPLPAPTPSPSGLRRSAPTTTMPTRPPPPSTQPILPSTTAVPSPTAPPPCDPNTPSELEQAILPLLVGTLAYDVDIDLLRIRNPNGSGFDLAAMAFPAA